MALPRPRYAMPEDVELALRARALTDAYLARPNYQQNDYIGWITRAKHQETRIKRLNQMLDELTDGTAYMKMPYSAKL